MEPKKKKENGDKVISSEMLLKLIHIYIICYTVIKKFPKIKVFLIFRL